MIKTVFSAVELGAAIRANRLALGQSQGKVAARVGCRRQTVADLERGRNVNTDTLMAVLSALGKGLQVVDARMDVERVAEFFADD